MKVEEGLEEIAAQLGMKHEDTLVGHLGIEMLELHRDRVRAKMPVDKRTQQPFGILHGGASVALAETVASIGAFINVAESGQQAFGLEINANHTRPVKEGWVLATAEPVHRGRSTQIWSIEIRDEKDKLVCVSRCTMAIR